MLTLCLKERVPRHARVTVPSSYYGSKILKINSFFNTEIINSTMEKADSVAHSRGTQLPNLSGNSVMRSSLTRSFNGPRITTGRAYFTARSQFTRRQLGYIVIIDVTPRWMTDFAGNYEWTIGAHACTCVNVYTITIVYMWRNSVLRTEESTKAVNSTT